jgi:hypothetical protein
MKKTNLTLFCNATEAIAMARRAIVRAGKYAREAGAHAATIDRIAIAEEELHSIARRVSDEWIAAWHASDEDKREHATLGENPMHQIPTRTLPPVAEIRLLGTTLRCSNCAREASHEFDDGTGLCSDHMYPPPEFEKLSP